MKALKFDLDIPFWCSFGDYASLNIKLSYPAPPLTTLFGLIQNAMGKPALHSITDKNYKKQLELNNIHSFNHLKFSILIRNKGELIEDFTNIHKGSRFDKTSDEKELKDILLEFKEDLDNHFNVVYKHEFYTYYIRNQFGKRKFDEAIEFINENEYISLFDKIREYWISKTKGFNGYNLNVYWMNTQINRQKIINPYFTIYLVSDDSEEFSIENIYNILNNPKRPLYLGESDDIVDILNLEIVDITQSRSSNISSIIPGIYANSELFKLPANLKYNINDSMDNILVCSIPNSDIDSEIDCYTYMGENFVFL